MRFIIFVIDSESNTANGNEMEAIDAFNEKLEKNDHWIYAAGISGEVASKVIDNRGGAGLTSAGSLYSDDNHYSGFWLIKADSQEQAEVLAAEGSLACNRRVELRPFLGN